MIIQLTKPKDWDNLKIGVQSVESQSFEKNMRYVEKNGDYDSFKNPKAINFVIKDNKSVIGYLMSSRLEDDIRCKKDKHYGKYDTFYLESIAIIPQYQGRGLGKKLFMKFMVLVKKRKYKRILLDATSQSMEGLALAFEFQKLKHYKNWEGKRSSWLMEKIL